MKDEIVSLPEMEPWKIVQARGDLADEIVV